METENNMKRSVSMRLILQKKKKKKDQHDVNVENKRLLITVNVVGSSGPLRFIVNDDDRVSTVIESSLKLYARCGRLPILGSDSKKFILYASDAGSALNSSEEIGSCGGRNFVLCKKENQLVPADARSRMITRHHSGRWKACIVCLAK
ncbi:hypothetical protein R6Q59_001417 [Mikania micrantha]|uniref:DUF7054 domain-containing protein n=1 Tax=Mikania micrantha TaxID=192012 RepID=A0A5N6NGX4_9ASTR|nr:hypothetical protein E3N88_20414 [Mikania micrantha]